MKSLVLFISCCLIALQSFGQERKYLLLTDEHISRFENRIENDPAAKNIWDEHYGDAKDLLKSDRMRANDYILLGFVYRGTKQD